MTVTQDVAATEPTTASGQPFDSITHRSSIRLTTSPPANWQLDHEHPARHPSKWPGAGRAPTCLPCPRSRSANNWPLIQNQLVNDIREVVGTWRAAGYPGANREHEAAAGPLDQSAGDAAALLRAGRGLWRH